MENNQRIRVNVRTSENNPPEIRNLPRFFDIPFEVVLDVVPGLFESDREMDIALHDSWNQQEIPDKNPDIELNIESGVATLEHTSEMCTVCMTNFEVSEIITKLECNHVLHSKCIGEWVKYKQECPVCRSHINTINTSTEDVMRMKMKTEKIMILGKKKIMHLLIT